MQHYQKIKAYECLSGSRGNYKGRLKKGNIEVVQTIYDEQGEVVKTRRRLFEDREAFDLATNQLITCQKHHAQ